MQPDFKSQSAAEITVAVPAKATDGTFYVVTKSGIEVPVGNIITVVANPARCNS